MPGEDGAAGIRRLREWSNGTPPSPDPHLEYDFPLFKAFAAARQYASTRAEDKAYRRRLARPFPKEVPALEVHASEVGPRDSRRRCEALLKLSWSLRYTDPEAMVLASSMAVALAERMDTSHNMAEELADLQARAWAELGNAHRVVDDLPASEGALARALDLSSHGSGDPLLLARLMDLTASLYTDQRRFDEAWRLLDGVHAIYLHMGDTHSAARALISKGYSLGVALESEEAVDLLRQGILLADAEREPKLIFVAVQSLLWFLFDCGQIAEVVKLLPNVREFYPVYAEGSVGLRAKWLEGRVAASLGEDERAEKILLQVREGFRIGERLYDTALVSLDLAAIWLRHGRIVEIKKLVDETVTTFRALNIQREVIAALLMLREALRKNQVTAALLQTVASELRRLERLPKAKAT